MTDNRIEKIRAEIERRLEDAKAGVRQNQNRVKFGLDSKQDLVIWQHLEGMAAQLLTFIDSMQEEPTTSVWHDAKEMPPDDIIVFRYIDGLTTCRYVGQTMKDVVAWAYFKDLKKL